MERSAYSLAIGDYIYLEQVNGEVITRNTPAEITGRWSHGPCITVLTTRGYVELDEFEIVKVA